MQKDIHVFAIHIIAVFLLCSELPSWLGDGKLACNAGGWEKAPNKHEQHFLIISNYNHVSFLFFLRWVGGVIERKWLWVQIISVLLNNSNNSFGPGDVFILDFQAPQSTHSKLWQKNEPECVGIKHLNSLLPGHYTDCHILHLPLPRRAFADLTSFTSAHYASGLCSTERNTVQWQSKTYVAGEIFSWFKN